MIAIDDLEVGPSGVDHEDVLFALYHPRYSTRDRRATWPLKSWFGALILLHFQCPAGRSDAESVLPGLESWLENGEGEAAWQLVDSDEVGMR